MPGAGAPQSLLQWHLSSRVEGPCSETSSEESVRLAINNQTRMLEKDMQLCGVVQKEWEPLGRWEGSHVYLDVSLEMKVKFALHVQRTEVMYKEHVEMSHKLAMRMLFSRWLILLMLGGMNLALRGSLVTGTWLVADL